MDDIIALRHDLHQYPELSNKEFATAKRITDFMKRFSPDEVVNLSKTGKAFVYNGSKNGDTVIFRAELDALPINEKSKLPYISRNAGVAHACGHDGHMAIIAGLAKKIAANPPVKGRTVLLFQPAEEVEQGANDVVNDPEFQKIEPNYIFALHNIPGVTKHKIVLKQGSFAAASKGMTVKLFGKTSHAAEPENGINPDFAIANIIKELHSLISDKKQFSDLTLLTIINIQLGEIAFGTSPGYAELRITLRAFENRDMQLLTQKTEEIINKNAQDEKLKCEILYSEVFPATVNDADCIAYIREAAKTNKLQTRFLEKPFKWSEDFGYYTEKYKGGFFGIGSGKNQPALHNPDFNFPDEIIETGIHVFYSIYQNINH